MSILNGSYSPEKYSRCPSLLCIPFGVSLISITAVYYGEDYLTGESIKRVAPFEGD
jgi:hypothetical protein